MAAHPKEIQQLIDDTRGMIEATNRLLERAGADIRFEPEPFSVESSPSDRHQQAAC